MASNSTLRNGRWCIGSGPADLPRRRVHFPSDSALGTVSVRALPRPSTAGRRSRRSWNGQWQELGAAQGSVEVPAGHELKLKVSGYPDYAQAFAHLGGNDIQTLAVGGRAAREVLEALALESLEELELWAAPVGDESMDALGRLTGLKVLNVWGTLVTDRGLGVLQLLAHLRALTLPGPRIGDPAMGGLAALPGLRTLDLAGSAVGDGGLADLSASSSIARLSLWGTEITDRGLPSLSAMRSLTEIDLGATAVSDEGLASLANLPLRRIGLRDSLVSLEGARWLHQAMGSCFVDVPGTQYCTSWRPDRLGRHGQVRSVPEE